MNARTQCALVTVLLVQLPLSAALTAQVRSAGPSDQCPAHTNVLHLSAGEGIGLSPVKAHPDRLRGALWGGGIGLVAGGLLGGLTVASDDGDEGFGGSLVEASATGEAVLLGALVGAAIGVVLGSTAFAPTHREDDDARVDSGFSASPVTSHEAIGFVIRFRR